MKSLNYYIDETERLQRCMPLIREKYYNTKHWATIQKMVELGINPLKPNGQWRSLNSLYATKSEMLRNRKKREG